MEASSIAGRLAVAAGIFVLAACSGGGGGGGNSNPATAVMQTPSFGTGSLGVGSSGSNSFQIFTTGSVAITNSAGSTPPITAPAAATVGNNTTAPPNGTLSLTGTSFPLKQSVISITSSGIGPDTTTNSGGATLSVLNWNPSGDSQFRLTIPALGVNSTFNSTTLLKGPATVSDSTFRLTSSNVNYATLGIWEADTTNGTAASNTIHLGAFTLGYETPVSAVPTSGSAAFTGAQSVAGIVTNYPSSGGIARAVVIGDASFIANFTNGTVVGAFANMVVGAGTNVTTPTPWNDIAITSSIASGTSHFSGTTAVASTPGTPYSLSGSATGRIEGGFYGPNATEIGAVWSLTDGTNVVIGNAQASHP